MCRIWGIGNWGYGDEPIELYPTLNYQKKIPHNPVILSQHSNLNPTFDSPNPPLHPPMCRQSKASLGCRVTPPHSPRRLDKWSQDSLHPPRRASFCLSTHPHIHFCTFSIHFKSNLLNCLNGGIIQQSEMHLSIVLLTFVYETSTKLKKSIPDGSSL